jgi:general secretion pathway protein A
MSYLDYFGLRHEPFSNAPVSRFYFDSEQHRQALRRLLHVVERMKGLAILVGDVGAGKSTLARRLLDQLPDTEYEAALIVIMHSQIATDWLLQRMALQLGVPEPAQDRVTVLAQLYKRWCRSTRRAARQSS